MDRLHWDFNRGSNCIYSQQTGEGGQQYNTILCEQRGFNATSQLESAVAEKIMEWYTDRKQEVRFKNIFVKKEYEKTLHLFNLYCGFPVSSLSEFSGSDYSVSLASSAPQKTVKFLIVPKLGEEKFMGRLVNTLVDKNKMGSYGRIETGRNDFEVKYTLYGDPGEVESIRLFFTSARLTQLEMTKHWWIQGEGNILLLSNLDMDYSTLSGRINEELFQEYLNGAQALDQLLRSSGGSESREMQIL